MSDIKLFSVRNGSAHELSAAKALLERDLQGLIEDQMETFLGVRFLASEYSTGKTHKGRIDSLGLDENGCPVIIEYKRHSNENVINQGLFYLDWLMDHQAEFQLLVMKKFGSEAAEALEWSGTRLLCIAADFNKYDEHAVQQINRNIELMRYRYFGQDLLLLELINAQTAQPVGQNGAAVPIAGVKKGRQSGDKSNTERLADAPDQIVKLYNSICSFIEQLGDEVQRKEVKLYTAFKRIKNFASVAVIPGSKDARLQVYLKLPGDLAEGNEFSRDVTNIGHWGTGNLELNLRTPADAEKAKPLIYESFQNN